MLQYVDTELLTQLVPRLVDIIKGHWSIVTRAGATHVGSLLSPTGPVAVYSLDFRADEVFKAKILKLGQKYSRMRMSSPTKSSSQHSSNSSRTGTNPATLISQEY